MQHHDLGGSQLDKFRQHLVHIVDEGSELSRTIPIKAENIFHQRGKRERVTNGERISKDSTIPRTMSIHFIVIGGYKFHLIRKAILGLEIRQTFKRQRGSENLNHRLRRPMENQFCVSIARDNLFHGRKNLRFSGEDGVSSTSRGHIS